MEQKQVIGTNFAMVVKEVEELVNKGYSVVHEGINGPYHAILGNFIVTLTKQEQKPKEEPKEDVVDVTTEQVVEKTTAGRKKRNG